MAASPFRFKGIDHVVVRCHDLARMLDFYQRVLGCELERVTGELHQLRAGTGLVDLVPNREPVTVPGQHNLDHFCLAIVNPDWRAIGNHLSAHGVEYAEPATRYGADGMGLSIYINDPEGNGVELKATAN